jgi:hypothetical protein
MQGLIFVLKLTYGEEIGSTLPITHTGCNETPKECREIKHEFADKLTDYMLF